MREAIQVTRQRPCVLPIASMWLGVLLAMASAPARARAQELGPNGSSINTSRYTIDLYEGQALGGTRMLALGGAYVAIAEDVHGSLQNPAAPAVREPHSVTWFDYGLSFNITYPFSVTDLFNSGPSTGKYTYDDTEFFFIAPSLNLQFGRLGVGVTFRGQSYRLDRTNSPHREGEQELRAQFFNIGIQLAHQLADGQLILGGGARIAFQRVVAGPGALIDNNPLSNSAGFGLEAGVLLRPNGRRYRVGAAFRTGIESTPDAPSFADYNEMGDLVVGDDFYIPESMISPWELDLGFAYQFGARPLNPRWTSLDEFMGRDLDVYRARTQQRAEQTRELVREVEERGGPDVEARRTAIQEEAHAAQRADDRAFKALRQAAKRAMRADYRSWSRQYLLVSTSMLITGPVPNAVGLESFLVQTVQRSGQNLVVSPRLGIESELWPNRLKARIGAYLEPSRLERANFRMHGTFGVDIAIVPWNVLGIWPDDYIWQVSGAIDLARDYFVWSFGIGGWY